MMLTDVALAKCVEENDAIVLVRYANLFNLHSLKPIGLAREMCA